MRGVASFFSLGRMVKGILCADNSCEVVEGNQNSCGIIVVRTVFRFSDISHSGEQLVCCRTESSVGLKNSAMHVHVCSLQFPDPSYT